MLGSLSCFFCRLLTFCSKSIFSKNSFRNTMRVSNSFYPHQDQYSLSVLIWVQTVCKNYQQTTKNTASRLRVKYLLKISNTWHGTMFRQGSSVNYYPVLSANTLLTFIMTVALVYKISSTKQQIITCIHHGF